MLDKVIYNFSLYFVMDSLVMGKPHSIPAEHDKLGHDVLVSVLASIVQRTIPIGIWNVGNRSMLQEQINYLLLVIETHPMERCEAC